MPNVLLTPQIITRECQRILHQKSNLIGRVQRQYDDRFAQRNDVIGQILNLRLPVKYTTRRGPTLAVQNTVQRSVPLPIASMFGIDMTFSSYELTFDLNTFSTNIIEPAMSQLAATIEGAFLQDVYKRVANFSGSTTTTVDYRSFQMAGRFLADNLAPPSQRTFGINPQTRVDFSDAVKGLFQSSDRIEEQYVEGKVGRTGGFDVYENTLLPSHTVGAYVGSPTVSGTQGNAGTGNAYVSTTSLATSGWTGNVTGLLKAGDIITISGVYEVHPETKANLGYLKRFVVQEDVDSTSGNATVPIAPGIIYGGAYQNASQAASGGATITVIGTASSSYGQNLAFHRDAFAFVSADLELPGDGKFEARERFENLSMRLIRKYDINNDKLPCRIDVAVGWTTVYAELACRTIHKLDSA